MNDRRGNWADPSCGCPLGASVALAAAACAASLIAGCGGAGDPAGVRVAVHGEVRLDGKPLEAGVIVFHSNVGAEEVVAFGTVEQGAYQIAAEEGPPAGTARVEFRPQPLPREQFEAAMDEAARTRRKPVVDVVAIPPRYGSGSTLTVAVAEEGDNKFDFDLRSRP